MGCQENSGLGPTSVKIISNGNLEGGVGSNCFSERSCRFLHFRKFDLGRVLHFRIFSMEPRASLELFFLIGSCMSCISEFCSDRVLHFRTFFLIGHAAVIHFRTFFSGRVLPFRTVFFLVGPCISQHFLMDSDFGRHRSGEIRIGVGICQMKCGLGTYHEPTIGDNRAIEE